MLFFYCTSLGFNCDLLGFKDHTTGPYYLSICLSIYLSFYLSIHVLYIYIYIYIQTHIYRLTNVSPDVKLSNIIQAIIIIM